MHLKQLHPGEKIRVLVVDDSVVVRRMVTHALDGEPGIEIICTASNGHIGLERVRQLGPDVVILDIEMPGMNGLEVLRALRAAPGGGPRVIMFSTLTERGASITLEALSLGADDYVTKVMNESSLQQSKVRLREELVPKIKQFFATSRPVLAAVPQRPRVSVQPSRLARTPRAVVIGSSTGGPAALAAILPQLPQDFPVPILIVQHMPPFFTRLLAERLDSACKLRVEEATEGAEVHAGKVLLAPGDFHMKLQAKGGSVAVSLDQSPQQNFCRPAVDVLFRSVAEVYGGAILAVILTGMGQDGLRGTETLRSIGATVFAQDEASSVVWGMPGAVVNAGLAHSVLPLEEIGAAMMSSMMAVGGRV